MFLSQTDSESCFLTVLTILNAVVPFFSKPVFQELFQTGDMTDLNGVFCKCWLHRGFLRDEYILKGSDDGV
jgi:hypothetical protein